MSYSGEPEPLNITYRKFDCSGITEEIDHDTGAVLIGTSKGDQILYVPGGMTKDVNLDTLTDEEQAQLDKFNKHLEEL